MKPAAVGQAFRDALTSGHMDAFADLYAEDARIDAGLQGKRHLIDGRERIRNELENWYGSGGELIDWSLDAYPEGLALWMERVDSAGDAICQRQYLHVREGHITGHWIYAHRAASNEPAVSRRPDPSSRAILDGIGEVVEHDVLVSSGWSGNRLECATLADGRRLVAKRVIPGAGWLERITNDPGREALLFLDGILERVPAPVDRTVVAAERVGDAWWVVMRDVSDTLLGAAGQISREQNQAVMRAANGMWEEFWGEEVPHTCRQDQRIGFTSSGVADEERDELDFIPKQFEAAWEGFAAAVEADVAEPILALLEDPGPLAAQLDACGTTLIHGDLRDENLGVSGEAVMMLDWGAATQGHPVVDLAWYMMHGAWRTEGGHDAMIEDFHRARGERDDPRALDLGMISGLVLYGWILGHSASVHPDPEERRWARWELDWWVPRVRRALESWSPG